MFRALGLTLDTAPKLTWHTTPHEQLTLHPQQIHIEHRPCWEPFRVCYRGWGGGSSGGKAEEGWGRVRNGGAGGGMELKRHTKRGAAHQKLGSKPNIEFNPPTRLELNWNFTQLTGDWTNWNPQQSNLACLKNPILNMRNQLVCIGWWWIHSHRNSILWWWSQSIEIPSILHRIYSSLSRKEVQQHVSNSRWYISFYIYISVCVVYI